MNPKATNKGASSRKLTAARSKMKRYTEVLSILSNCSRDSFSPESTAESPAELDWTEFPHKGEFFELREGGFIVGTPVYHDSDQKYVLTNAGITSSGVSQLAQLSDYLWTTSPFGKLVDGLGRILWMLVGGLIGYLLHA